MAQRAAQFQMALRPEEGDAGERRQRVVAHFGHTAVGGHLVDVAIEHDHLAVEHVERAQPEVAVPPHLAEGHALLVDAFDDGVDRGGEVECIVFHGLRVVQATRLAATG